MNDTNQTDTENGVQLDLLNGDKLQDLTSNEKIRLILDSVQKENIVILEIGLEPEEESKLIERTMTQIQPDGFSGIEIETYQPVKEKKTGLIGRVLNKDDNDSKLTIIGPANKIQTLHKDEQLLSTLVTNN